MADYQEAMKNSKPFLKEQLQIRRKVQKAGRQLFHDMLQQWIRINLTIGLFYGILLVQTTLPLSVFVWYAALTFSNLTVLYWISPLDSKKTNSKKRLFHRNALILNLILTCLIWGSTSLLFMSNGYEQQMVTFTFLSLILICSVFATLMDLTIAITSIVCLIAPIIIKHLYLALQSHTPLDHYLAIGIVIIFLLMGGFMLVVNFLSNRLGMKLFRINYQNKLLRKKLRTIHATHEINIKERTDELQSSLHLVSYQSTHDLLTELPNERSLNEYTQEAIERAIRKHYKFALACFSLNGMEKIKVGLGYQASATIIKRVAQRLINYVSNKHSKYFISLSRQDIFTILIEPVSDVTEIEHSIKELFSVLHEPIYISDQALKLTGSVGVCVYPADGRELNTLITNAESARVLASKHGGNSMRIYHTVINADAYRQFNIENELYYALENNELSLHYQPFVDLQTDTIRGAEALIRWKNPMLGAISPVEFINIAEANGMILPIGEWVLLNACKQLKKLHTQGYKDFTMSVNLSAKQLTQKSLVEYIQMILKQLKLNPKYLKLELTESEAFQKEVIPIINQFTDMGISLVIDDFGTGYSDFTNFKFFKVGEIKIDKLFIQDLDVNMDSRHIVCNTIALAKRMNIACVAEGVENIEQLKFLKDNGCHSMQGYYFSKPLHAEDFEAYMLNYIKNGLNDKLLF